MTKAETELVSALAAIVASGMTAKFSDDDYIARRSVRLAARILDETERLVARNTPG